VIGIAFVRIELYGEVCVRMDYKGCRILVPILYSLCVELITVDSGAGKTLLNTIVKLLGHEGRNDSPWFGPLLVVGGVILWMALLQWSMVCVHSCMRAC